MPKPINLTGWRQPDGRLTVLALAPKDQWPVNCWPIRSWICLCDCGEIRVVTTARLTRGNTRSCGCLQRDKAHFTGLYNSTHSRERICPHCRLKFLGTIKQIFCTAVCKEAYYLVSREQWNCETCGKPVRARQRQRWCCVTCKSRGRKRSPLGETAVLTAGSKLAQREEDHRGQEN